MRNDHRSIHAGTTGDRGDLRRTGHRHASASATLAALGLALTAALAPPSPADAATGPAWRCGNAYSDTPCPGGRRIDPAIGPGDADRRAADEATRRIEQRADAMERDRLRGEQAAAARNGAVVLPDHRIAEARDREARRLAAQRAAWDEERRRNRSSGPRTVRRHADASAGRRR